MDLDEPYDDDGEGEVQPKQKKQQPQIQEKHVKSESEKKARYAREAKLLQEKLAHERSQYDPYAPVPAKQQIYDRIRKAGDNGKSRDRAIRALRRSMNKFDANLKCHKYQRINKHLREHGSEIERTENHFHCLFEETDAYFKLLHQELIEEPDSGYVSQFLNNNKKRGRRNTTRNRSDAEFYRKVRDTRSNHDYQEIFHVFLRCEFEKNPIEMFSKFAHSLPWHESLIRDAHTKYHNDKKFRKKADKKIGPKKTQFIRDGIFTEKKIYDQSQKQKIEQQRRAESAAAAQTLIDVITSTKELTFENFSSTRDKIKNSDANLLPEDQAKVDKAFEDFKQERIKVKEQASDAYKTLREKPAYHALRRKHKDPRNEHLKDFIESARESVGQLKFLYPSPQDEILDLIEKAEKELERRKKAREKDLLEKEKAHVKQIEQTNKKNARRKAAQKKAIKKTQNQRKKRKAETKSQKFAKKEFDKIINKWAQDPQIKNKLEKWEEENNLFIILSNSFFANF